MCGQWPANAFESKAVFLCETKHDSIDDWFINRHLRFPCDNEIGRRVANQAVSFFHNESPVLKRSQLYTFVQIFLNEFTPSVVETC